MVGIGRSLVTHRFHASPWRRDCGFHPARCAGRLEIWPVGLDPGGIALGLVMSATLLIRIQPARVPTLWRPSAAL